MSIHGGFLEDSEDVKRQDSDDEFADNSTRVYWSESTRVARIVAIITGDEDLIFSYGYFGIAILGIDDLAAVRKGSIGVKTSRIVFVIDSYLRIFENHTLTRQGYNPFDKLFLTD